MLLLVLLSHFEKTNSLTFLAAVDFEDWRSYILIGSGTLFTGFNVWKSDQDHSTLFDQRWMWTISQL